MLDNPNEKVMIYGDFNVHNQEWIHSNTTDSGGILTQEFVELFGLKQIVNFPTRGSNTLDLICSNIDASAAGLMPFGTSDHKAIRVEMQVTSAIPTVLKQADRPQWRTAPWKHTAGT